MQDNTTEEAVNSILSQLKDVNVPEKKAKQNKEKIDPEKLEQFIIDKSSDLITKSLEVFDEYKDILSSAPSEESAEALSNLINAATSAIETLNKVLAVNKKTNTSVKLKTMDIESKQLINQRDNITKLVMTRSQLMELLEEPEEEAVDVEVEESKKT